MWYYLQHYWFLLRIALAVWDLLCFHMNFKTVFFSVKKSIPILIGDCLESVATFCSVSIFTILIFLAHEHERSLHPLGSFLSSFSTVSTFSI